MNFNKTLIALALSSTLAACGGSSDSSTPKTETPKNPPAAVETVVEGKAIKGVLNNAVVTVYKFVDGAPVALTADELSESDIVTDAQGNYTFTVLDYTGPIKIELSPSTDPANPTTMTCDAPDGCGGVALGSPIDLTAADPSFKLAAISMVDNESSGEVKVNVSALTHLAAELIEADENGISAEVVAAQSATIASNFGIVGDITLLEPTVTTDAGAVAGEDNEAELRYGLINAGIMQALFTGETNGTAILSTKLAEVATDLKANEGKILVNQDEDDGFELSLSDVLTGAASAAEKAADAIKADDTLTGTEAILGSLDQEEVNLANEQAYQEANVGEDGLAETGVDAPTEGDAIAKAKAMVDDIRLFSHLFDVTSTQGAGIKTQGDEYVALLDDASAMIDQEASSFTLIAKLSDVIAELATDFDEGTLTNETTSAGMAMPAGVLSDAGSGTITFNENTATGGVLFTVDATDAGETVQLNVSAEFADEGKTVVLMLNGLIESAGAKLTLSEGSFAKIALDIAASREAFDSGEYEGEVISGELDLALELAQKSSDAVTDPITFSGMLKTKLLPVGKRTFNSYSHWEESLEQRIYNISRPEIKRMTLPETFSLSGGFTSLEGDSINATLTINSNNLAAHQAPDFKYIGKEIENVLAVTISEDLNTFTLADGDSVEGATAGTRVFIAGDETGDWDVNTTLVPNSLDDTDWTSNLESKFISRPFDTELDQNGLVFSSATVVAREEADDYFVAARLVITPVDYDSNGTTDAYSFVRFSIDDQQDYDGSSISTLLDAEGNILLSNGEVAAQENGWHMGEFTSIEQFIEENSWAMPVNPFEVENGTEFLAGLLTYQWHGKINFYVDNEGLTTVYFDEDEIAAIASGDVKSLNPSAYLTKALLKDGVAIEVSEDANMVSVLVNNETIISRTFNYIGDVDTAGNFEFITHFNFDYSEDAKVLSQTSDIGLDVDEVLITKTLNEGKEYQWIEQIKITPVDNNEDDIADVFKIYRIVGNYINDNGQLVDYGDDIVEFSGVWYQFNSYEDDNWNAGFEWLLNFNPYKIDSALALSIADNNKLDFYVRDLGQVEYEFTQEDLESIVVNSTTTFDAYLIESDDNILENEDNFINVNAALTLEAVLGDYEVKAQLSGKRTAFSEGKFDLELTYNLPGEDAQRSFTVHADTEEEGKLTANNFEGVVLVLEEPAEDTEGTQVIGKILVGPTLVAATIEDRDGVIVIVYSNDDEDEVTEIETL